MTIGDVYGDTIDCKDYSNVSITSLAYHTSGITDFSECPKKRLFLKKYEDMEGMKSRKKMTYIILSQPAHYKPGSKWSYCNKAYGILGAIMEKYIEQDYTSIIEKYIFEPLKIKANYKSYYTGDGYAEGHVNQIISRNDEYRPLGKNEYVKQTYEEPAGEIYLNIIDSS